MKAIRFILAMLSTPLLAPALMYGATYLFAVGSGSSLSFSLANYYQVGLPYAYAIFVLVGTPLFALLQSKRIHSVLAFIASGAAIFLVLMGLLLGYAAVKNEQLNIFQSDGIFFVSAVLTGAALGAIFWAVAIAGHHEKTQSNT
jgi:hypothetical protein